jgi:diamine N-acetyltransferase
MLTGKRVRLRAIEREDIPTFVRWLNDREVTQFLLVNTPFSKAMEEKWFEGQLANAPTHGQILAIEARAGEEWVHIGNTGIHNIEPVHLNAEFGILIGEKSYWNQGYGREATRLTLQHGFEDLNLHRIFLHVYDNNPRAIAAYKAAGFVQEGILREAVYKNGKYLNIIVMSVLHTEWNRQLEQGE